MQGVGDCPECLCVASVLAAVCDKGHGVTALRGGTPHGHKAGRDFLQIFVPLDTLAFHHVRGLQYQLVFGVHVVANRNNNLHGKVLDVVKYPLADPGHVHAQIREVVLVKQLFDLLCLVAEVHSFPVNHLQHTEFFHGKHRRGDDDETRQIAAACRVKAAPDWLPDRKS